YLIVVLWFLLVFFFQAEDGIRDFHVTGVQTCALPIFRRCGCRFRRKPASDPLRSAGRDPVHTPVGRRQGATVSAALELLPAGKRSEERRVGREGRYRWWHTRRHQTTPDTRHTRPSNT